MHDKLNVQISSVGQWQHMTWSIEEQREAELREKGANSTVKSRDQKEPMPWSHLKIWPIAAELPIVYQWGQSCWNLSLVMILFSSSISPINNTINDVCTLHDCQWEQWILITWFIRTVCHETLSQSRQFIMGTYKEQLMAARQANQTSSIQN